MLDLAAQFYCKPPLDITIDEWEMHDKTILEVHIPQGDDKPYSALGEDDKWWVYIQVNDQSLLASKIVVDVLRRQHGLEGVHIQYSSKEQALMDYLEKNRRITLKEFCKLLNISRWRSRKSL